MLLSTSIAPRRDGTVKASVAGTTYVFAPDADGDLVADIVDEAVVAQLLAGGLFYPASPADIPTALAITERAAAADADDADDDADAGADALPVEANTPPVPARKRAARKGA